MFWIWHWTDFIRTLVERTGFVSELLSVFKYLYVFYINCVVIIVDEMNNN